ncbi:MAG: hypothetical protein JWP69_1644 [Flaviaesturariibacter sp.]|nr:hypothetical protein [Flaviaesturariibacter sp.]
MAPIDSIHQPATYLSKKRLPVLSYQEYLRLHAYRLHLDSLLKSGDMGQRQTRDTILFLEGIYLQQFKK